MLIYANDEDTLKPHNNLNTCSTLLEMMMNGCVSSLTSIYNSYTSNFQVIQSDAK